MGFEPLLGTDEATLDDKGRLIFTKKKRDRLGDGFTVTLGPKGCLEAYPAQIWSVMVANLLTQDALNEGVGEMTANSPLPAIVNAIYDAVGVWITDLPVTPEKVLRALEEKENAA